MLLSLALLLTACKPNHAEISGQWHVWLAANNSATVSEGKLDLAETATRIYECSGRGWDDDLQAFEPGYIGPTSGADYQTGRYFGGACDPSDSSCDQAALDADCALLASMEFYPQLNRDGYYYLTEPLDTWRSEAIMTSEGDFQLTFHNRLGKGQDFRLAFVITPDFAPLICDDPDGDGTAEAVVMDGTNWVEAWTANQGLDGQLYYLNAGAQQTKPDKNSATEPEIWYLENDWAGGFAHAKFAAEEFISVPNVYGQYDEYGVGTHFEVSASSQEGTLWGSAISRLDPDMDEYAALSDDLKERSDAWAREISGVAMGGVSPEQADTSLFELRVEDNAWRPIDLDIEGLDGWMEVASSWVTVDPGSQLEVGGSASGEFQILFTGYESSSLLVAKGSWSVDRIRKDPWAYDVLEDEKRAESGNEFCK